MVKFIDGPAIGIVLELRRAPVMLRVTRSTVNDEAEYDALDQPDDSPAEYEEVFVYEIVGSAGAAFVDRRDKQGRRFGNRLAVAQYRECVDPPYSPADVRTKEAWDAWCTRHRETIVARHPDIRIGGNS